MDFGDDKSVEKLEDDDVEDFVGGTSIPRAAEDSQDEENGMEGLDMEPKKAFSGRTLITSSTTSSPTSMVDFGVKVQALHSLCTSPTQETRFWTTPDRRRVWILAW